MRPILAGVISMMVGTVVFGGCARLPYDTQVIHEGPLVRVALQKEIQTVEYSHPVQASHSEMAAILRGFSIREQQRLPLRWFAEEAPPKQLFREDELQVLSPYLTEALRKAGPQERIYFMVFAPGINPQYRRDVTGGWIAVRGSLLHLTVDYFHVQQPVRRSDPYDYNYPTPWSIEKTYLLYFEPGRFYLTDSKTASRGVDIKEFLKAAPNRGPVGPAPPTSSQ